MAKKPDTTKQPEAPAAVVIVKTRSAASRRRAGYGFGREETKIPAADLSADALKALQSDPELVVTVIAAAEPPAPTPPATPAPAAPGADANATPAAGAPAAGKS